MAGDLIDFSGRNLLRDMTSEHLRETSTGSIYVAVDRLLNLFTPAPGASVITT